MTLIVDATARFRMTDPIDPMPIAHATPITVAAFYKFVDIDDPTILRHELGDLCGELDIKGTILLAQEGINATISGPDRDITAVIGALRANPGFSDLIVKYSNAASHPFQRFKIKIKPEIVTFGVPDLRPSVATGELVEPGDWNKLIADPDVILIDARNDYEFRIGTFEGALNPRTRAFSELRDYMASELAGAQEKKIAMFCTGGIRCEKASAYLLAQGFTRVHQLSGGILRYLEEIPAGESLWRGECFVFDERVALEHGVRQGHHELCARCGSPRPASGADSANALCDECRHAMAAP